MGFDRQFKYYSKVIGRIGSDANWDIYSVDYTAADQVGSSTNSNISIRADLGNKFAEPAIPGAMYYDLFLDFQKVSVGNILYPTGSNPNSFTWPGGPIITVAQQGLLKSCVGLLTDVLGAIVEDQATVRYDNVRWQWCRQGQPKTGRNRQLEDSFPTDKRTAVMLRRPGVPYPIFKGMHLLEYGVINRAFEIVDINFQGPYAVMLVEESDG